ncbi:MAG: hypothetical protein NTW87_24145 [Planctomycetota bacterium]|nr:hypothetical protein [Planctomycetota bacterium]
MLAGSSGPASDEALLEHLRFFARAIRKVAWRRRRDLSLAFYRTWRKYGPTEMVYRHAKTLAGVAPEAWFTISEAQRALQRLGVAVCDQTLYRLRRKAGKSGNDVITVAMDRRGDWDGVQNCGLRDPAAVLTIRLKGPVHFRVSRFCPKT